MTTPDLKEARRLADVLDFYATGDEYQRPAEKAVAMLRAQADELERLRAQVALPAQPTPEMLDALRTGSRRDVPSDELCRVRYAALLAAAPAQQAPVTMRQAIESGKTRSELRAGITSDAERAAPAAIWYSPALGDFVVTDPGESGFVRYAQAEPVAWRDHVEQRIREWRQRTMNRSGDHLAIDDFMDAESIDDLVDYVCDEWAGPPPQPPAQETE